MNIKCFQGGFDKNFSYLIWCNKTKLAAIVDPAVEINQIVESINKNNLNLIKIFITHTHHDHISYLEDFKYLFSNVEVLCSKKTSKQVFNFSGLSNNEVVALGEEVIICLDTPGHYYDSMCFWDKKNKSIFTGDTIFVGRTGRTISLKSNIKDLYNSVYNIILNLPRETIIYPGHHYGHVPFITIQENITLFDFFSCNNFNKFCLVMENFEKNR
jgi:glyoxylase-like metal-dependent hydrolase (beta-lactamase superfamily II)